MEAMSEISYEINSVIIAGLLFALMAVTIELGYRLGLRIQSAVAEPFKAHVSTTLSSLLGILALLLGFTFSLSLQRYDSRNEAVVEEANAIGTAYLRAQLLPSVVREDVLGLMRQYVDVRVKTGQIDLTQHQTRDALTAEAGRLQNSLWAYARQANELAPSPVTTGLFIPALNELIDDYGKRDAEMNRHVPELVLGLLYITFVMTGAILGYSNGLAGHRTPWVTYVMVWLIVVMVFIILDLDRPYRGLIQISQKSMLDLQTTIRGDSGANPQP